MSCNEREPLLLRRRKLLNLHNLLNQFTKLLTLLQIWVGGVGVEEVGEAALLTEEGVEEDEVA